MPINAPDIIIILKSNLYIFAGIDSNNVTGSNNIRISEVKVFDDRAEEPLHVYVPTKRLNDDELGMYDLISDTFHTNSGRGSFIDGPIREWTIISCPGEDKADKVSNATSGNFAGLDSNGNLVDSGHKHSDYLSSSTTIPTITFRQW